MYINVLGRDEFAITADRRLRQALAMGTTATRSSRTCTGQRGAAAHLVPPALLGAQKDKVKGPPAYDPARRTPAPG